MKLELQYVESLCTRELRDHSLSESTVSERGAFVLKVNTFASICKSG